VQERLEDEFLSRSDDGILEHLIEEGKKHSGERWEAIVALASSVQNRRLFKRAARADSPADLAEAEETHAKFGSAEKRRQLERQAARIAGVSPGWKVVIWLPAPTMRMKVAEVLVDNGQGVAKLDDLGGPSRAIVDAHKRLWAITVYIEPELFAREPNRVRAMLGFLRDSLDIALHDNKGRPILGLREYAVELVAAKARLTPPQAEQIQELFTRQAAAAGATGSFTELVETAYRFARSENFTRSDLDTSEWDRWSPTNPRTRNT
jgi:hypothetical protein